MAAFRHSRRLAFKCVTSLIDCKGRSVSGSNRGTPLWKGHPAIQGPLHYYMCIIYAPYMHSTDLNNRIGWCRRRQSGSSGRHCIAGPLEGLRRESPVVQRTRCAAVPDVTQQSHRNSGPPLPRPLSRLRRGHNFEHLTIMTEREAANVSCATSEFYLK